MKMYCSIALTHIHTLPHTHTLSLTLTTPTAAAAHILYHIKLNKMSKKNMQYNYIPLFGRH